MKLMAWAASGCTPPQNAHSQKMYEMMPALPASLTFCMSFFDSDSSSSSPAGFSSLVGKTLPKNPFFSVSGSLVCCCMVSAAARRATGILCTGVLSANDSTEAMSAAKTSSFAICACWRRPGHLRDVNLRRPSGLH